MNELDKLALTAILAGQSHSMIGLYLNRTSNSVTRRLQKLEKQGYVIQKGRGQYQLTNKGRDVASPELPPLKLEITPNHRIILKELPRSQAQIRKQYNIPLNVMSLCIYGLREFGYIEKTKQIYTVTAKGRQLLHNEQQICVTKQDPPLKDPEEIKIKYPPLPDGCLLNVIRKSDKSLRYILTYRHISCVFNDRPSAHIAASNLTKANLPQANNPYRLSEWYKNWLDKVAEIVTSHGGYVKGKDVVKKTPRPARVNGNGNGAVYIGL